MQALQRIALANGAVDKIGGGVNYESMIRPSRYRWPEWIERCRTQGLGALAALDALDWPDAHPLDQALITTGCAIDYIAVTQPALMPETSYPTLARLLKRVRAMPEFAATSFQDYAVPRAE
jgi:glutathione S-transferase